MRDAALYQQLLVYRTRLPGHQVVLRGLPHPEA